MGIPLLYKEIHSKEKKPLSYVRTTARKFNYPGISNVSKKKQKEQSFISLKWIPATMTLLHQRMVANRMHTLLQTWRATQVQREKLMTGEVFNSEIKHQFEEFGEVFVLGKYLAEA